MNAARQIQLAVVPQYQKDELMTTQSDGTPCSYVFDKSWDYSGMQKFSSKANHTLPFADVDASYRRDIQKTLAFIVKGYHKKYGEHSTLSQVDGWRVGLVRLRKVLQSSDWASLSDDRFFLKFEKNLELYVQINKLSKSTVSRMLTALNKLNEACLCERNIDGRKWRGFVVRDVKQHIAIPISMYQKLIAEAIKVVETYHPHRHAINAVQLEAESIYKEETDDSSKSARYQAANHRAKKRFNKLSHNIPNFHVKRNGTEVGRINAACAVVVLAFSGVRIGEMTSFSKDSYEEKGANRIPILKGEETKREGRVIHETWQTHPIAKDALELAFDASQFKREQYEQDNNQRLLRGEISPDVYQRGVRRIKGVFLSLGKGRGDVTNYIELGLDSKIYSFGKSIDLVATQEDVDEFNRLNPAREGQLKVGGLLPKLSPHDFRRSFAVFFKRYGFGSSTTIKFQYKHRNINMSDYYANNAQLQAMEDILLDSDLLELLNEAGIQSGVDIFDEIYNESTHLAGGGGERIAKDKLESLRSGEHLFMSREEIESLVRNGTLSAVRLPTGGYCTNATCSRLCGLDGFVAEKKPCDHQVITDKQAKVILKQNKRLIEAFRAMNTGDPMMNSILVAQKQKIKLNEQLIKDFNLKFEAFSDKVKGTIETVEV